MLLAQEIPREFSPNNKPFYPQEQCIQQQFLPPLQKTSTPSSPSFPQYYPATTTAVSATATTPTINNTVSNYQYLSTAVKTSPISPPIEESKRPMDKSYINAYQPYSANNSNTPTPTTNAFTTQQLEQMEQPYKRNLSLPTISSTPLMPHQPQHHQQQHQQQPQQQQQPPNLPQSQGFINYNRNYSYPGPSPYQDNNFIIPQTQPQKYQIFYPEHYQLIPPTPAAMVPYIQPQSYPSQHQHQQQLLAFTQQYPPPPLLLSQYNMNKMPKTSKKHICNVCGKRFTRPSSLQTHAYSHTGEKPFRCDFEGCGRNFSVVSNLRRHKKIHGVYNSK